MLTRAAAPPSTRSQLIVARTFEPVAASFAAHLVSENQPSLGVAIFTKEEEVSVQTIADGKIAKDTVAINFIGPIIEEFAFRGCAQFLAYRALSGPLFRVSSKGAALLSRIFGSFLFAFSHGIVDLCCFF